MPLPDANLEQKIRDAAAGPARASNETGSVDQQPLGELIDADRYLASKEAATNPRKALRFTKLVPPGAAG
ncbi:MAG: hypothetical protein KF724_12420 [Phycisphaeraceae bacterium]|nr:hypothetical protein [Phycisphaeraceae bacterium]